MKKIVRIVRDLIVIGAISLISTNCAVTNKSKCSYNFGNKEHLDLTKKEGTEYWKDVAKANAAYSLERDRHETKKDTMLLLQMKKMVHHLTLVMINRLLLIQN